MHPRALLPLALIACGRTEDDEAHLCFDDPTTFEETSFFEQDVPVTLHVRDHSGCEMKSVEVACEATVDGDVITVHTETAWVSRGFVGKCESILMFANGSCETPPLPAGTYTVDYAGQQTTIEVPGAAPTDCVIP